MASLDRDADAPRTVEELEERLSRPREDVIEILARMPGDIVFLGVGGKMGPSMARLARRASDAAGIHRRVIGVSRFSTPELRARLESWGIETISCDLLDAAAVKSLPDAPLVVSMSGFKFGTSSAPGVTWATNCYVPVLVGDRYRDSRIVAFSTGNVYGLVPVERGGSQEDDPLAPVGEYAMAALGRERMYDYASRAFGCPVTLLRLNYATELRYGVLVDLAEQIWAGQKIDLSMAYVNVIWLGDANAMTLRAFDQCHSPPTVLNLAGLPILRTRDVCLQLGQLLGRPVEFAGQESDRALLNDGRRGYELLGQPHVPAEQMIHWTADWVARGGQRLGKPTHFQSVSGKF